ncbi:hypothetical protein Cgig2_033948 [Carnegiea gigantea]|uniref:Uncharacterized protein n=1 Tax=Carnegiea gigantea TaxID=171969 RepID=A0A9Q1GG26_9CARY|nr:hypothetical protein Cgig2_033948 [Carnegiea gigantea]
MRLLRMGCSILHFQYRSLLRILSMAFPHSLSTREMAEYVANHFEWEWYGAAFPPLPLPKDFQALRPSYELTVAEEAAGRFEPPELPQLGGWGSCMGGRSAVMESALTELRWSTSESWVWLNGDRIFEARTLLQGGKLWETAQSALSVMAFPPLRDTREMANFDLCSRFVISEAEQAACNFELPKMVDATFYAMFNDTVRLGLMGGFMAASLKVPMEGREAEGLERVEMNLFPNFASTEQAAEYVRDNFRWSLRDPSALGPRPLPLDYHGLCPHFDLGVATRYAHDSNILEMARVIFYAMVIDDAVKLGLSCRLTMNCAPERPSFLTCKPIDGPCIAGWPSGRKDDLFSYLPEHHTCDRIFPPLVCEGVFQSLSEPFAYAARIPEMVQAIFYAMVINDAAELRLSSRDALGDMMLELQELRCDIVEAWVMSIDARLRDAQVSHLVEMVYNPRPRPEVTSRLRGVPPLSSDGE